MLLYFGYGNVKFKLLENLLSDLKWIESKLNMAILCTALGCEKHIKHSENLAIVNIFPNLSGMNIIWAYAFLKSQNLSYTLLHSSCK